MDNKDQLQKGVYQVPSSPSGESFDTQTTSVDTELSQAEVDQAFSEIAREEVSRAFSKITQDLELSLSGYEAPIAPVVETLKPDSIALELLQVGEELQKRREAHHQSLVESAGITRLVSQAIAHMFTNKKSVLSLRPTIEDVVEHESKHVKIFPHDPDVTSLKFFFLPDQEGHKWYHAQTSALPEKHFTNSYAVKETGIEKSSSFYAKTQGRIVNVSLPVTPEEAQNLLVASKHYYKEVTGNVYAQKPVRHLRFRSKDDLDLAA